MRAAPRDGLVLRSARTLLSTNDVMALHVQRVLPYLACGHVEIVPRANAIGRDEWAKVLDDQNAFFDGYDPAEPAWNLPVRELLLDLCYQLSDRDSFDLVAQRYREWVGRDEEELGRVLRCLGPNVAFLLRLLSERVLLLCAATVKAALAQAGHAVHDKRGSWRATVSFVNKDIVTVTASRTLVGDAGDDLSATWSVALACERRAAEKTKLDAALKIRGMNVLAAMAAAKEGDNSNNNSNNNNSGEGEYTVEAQYAHDGASDTELTLAVGDAVAVALKHPSGWWRGRVLARDDGGAAVASSGWFPASKTRPTAATLELIKARAKEKYANSNAKTTSLASVADSNGGSAAPKLRAGDRAAALWREADQWHAAVVREVLAADRYRVQFCGAQTEQLCGAAEVSALGSVTLADDEGLPGHAPPQADTGAAASARRGSIAPQKSPRPASGQQHSAAAPSPSVAPPALALASVQLALVDTTAKGKVGKLIRDAFAGGSESDVSPRGALPDIVVDTAGSGTRTWSDY